MAHGPNSTYYLCLKIRVLLEQTCPLVYILSLTAFVHSSIVATQTFGLQSLNHRLSGPLWKKCVNGGSRTIGLIQLFNKGFAHPNQHSPLQSIHLIRWFMFISVILLLLKAFFETPLWAVFKT